MQVNTTIKWDAEYDVVVLGFGGAGATAARFAADNGAKVLLIDSAPEGEEGGNTRYCGQIVGSGSDYEKLYNYYSQLTAPMDLNEDMKKTFVSGMYHMKDYMKKYLGVEPFSFDQSPKYNQVMKNDIHEYPEFEGSEVYDFLTVHESFFDAALWKILKKKVTDRSQNIDIWYESPALHLIQDEYHKTVLGAQIERKGVLINVSAKNGVIMTLGGFENNPQKMQDYLGTSNIAPLGSLYNQGAGIDMAIEAGAQLWHMRNFESLGMLHGMSIRVDKGNRAKLDTVGVEKLHIGSIFVAGDDGSRYFDESEANRHGHLYNHGYWTVPQNQDHPYAIFDQKQYNEMQNDHNKTFFTPFLESAVSAKTIPDLAKKINADPQILANEIDDFNFFANKKKDYKFNRGPETLRAFSDGPFYAVPLEQTMLNTQGGPLRNTKAEILDINNQPIPHLYGAGELGGICANQYQGGGNIAECLIFGKIAGENAAKEKSADVTASVIGSKHSVDDNIAKSLVADNNSEEDFSTTNNQFIGKSSGGIGDEMVVRITCDDNHSLQNIEILKQSETERGAAAIEKMPQEMISQNTYDVDIVSGASSTGNALKAAVKDALDQAAQQV